MGILEQVLSCPCHPQNRGGRRQAGQIRYLVYHYTGNDGDTDGRNAEYYRDNVVQASAHYFVDDDSVTRSVEDLEVAWAVGGKKWSDCPRTGGGSLYGKVTNANSISIELCDTVKDGRLMATEATLERGARLGRELMEKYHIPPERVARHFDVTGKHCPAYFMDSVAWEAFKERLKDAAGESPRPTEGEDGPMGSSGPTRGEDGPMGSSGPTRGEDGPMGSSGPTKEEDGPMGSEAGPAEVVGPHAGETLYSTEGKEENEMKIFRTIEEVPQWGRSAVESALRKGTMKRDGEGLFTLWEPNVQPLVWLDRLGLLR